MPVNIILIGPPGAGKGTQAARICACHSVPLISTGEILRAAVKAGNSLGKEVKAILATGGLVDDDLMIALVRDRLAEPDTAMGFVLDGFPRTIAQARALDGILHARPFQAILLVVQDADLERRLSSRRVCLKCKALYTSRSAYGSEEELCSKCGVPLIIRDDDNLETIRHRLLTYRATVDPIVKHYDSRGVLKTVDGSKTTEQVAAAISRRIGPATAQKKRS